MKLKFTRKGRVPSVADKDATVKQKMVIRLNTVSEVARRTELKSAAVSQRLLPPAKPREPDAPPAVRNPDSKNLTLNRTRKTLATSNTAAMALALETESEEVKRKWKARSFFGRHLPLLQCNNCSISRVCPKYKAGYECAFLPYLNSHKIETASDLIRYMKQFTENSMRRAQLMSLQESASGGMPSVEASEALDMAFKQLKDLHTVITEETEESIEIEGSSSLVGSIFGGMKAKKLLEETIAMKKVDPVLELPAAPEVSSVKPEAKPEEVSAELIRDAILNQGHAKKGLLMPATASIEQSELR